MPLHHICKAIHFMSPVLCIISTYYIFLIWRIFIYLFYLWILKTVKCKSTNKAPYTLKSGTYWSLYSIQVTQRCLDVVEAASWCSVLSEDIEIHLPCNHLSTKTRTNFCIFENSNIKLTTELDCIYCLSADGRPPSHACFTPYSLLHHSRHGYDSRHGADGFTSRLRKLCLLRYHSERNISKFQKAQNLLMHVMFNIYQSNSHTLLQQLRWLPTEHIYQF